MKKLHKRATAFTLVCGIIVACCLFWFHTQKNKKSEIVFVGDSITFGYVGSTEEHLEDRFSTLLCNDLNASEYNYSLCGSTISNIKNDGMSVTERFSNVEEKPGLWIIGGGTNDFIQNVPLDVFEVSVKNLMEQVDETKTKCIFVTPACFKIGDKGLDYPDKNGKRKNWPNHAGATLDEYVEIIIRVCECYGVYVLDLYHDEQMDNILHQEKYYDLVHPNLEGHKYIYEKILRIIKRNRLL